MNIRTLLLITVMTMSCVFLSVAAPPPAHPISQERAAKLLVRGKTTRAEVIRDFGEPATRHPGPRGLAAETFTYSQTVKGKLSVLLVQLDGRGRVVGYLFSQK
jgi:hypothetical protein